MSKIKVCKHTQQYDSLVKVFKDKNIDFKTKDCLKKCSKCRSKILIQKGDAYLSAKSIEKLLAKLESDDEK